MKPVLPKLNLTQLKTLEIKERNSAVGGTCKAGSKAA